MVSLLQKKKLRLRKAKQQGGVAEPTPSTRSVGLGLVHFPAQHKGKSIIC